MDAMAELLPHARNAIWGQIKEEGIFHISGVSKQRALEGNTAVGRAPAAIGVGVYLWRRVRVTR
jgi:hypothetical protein